MQGMIAEYERAKIMERNRRGKIHAAKRGSINVLTKAPYGYRYISKQDGAGQALYEINIEEAEVVKKIFSWIGKNRLSIGEVCRRLKGMNINSPKGKSYWNKGVIWLVLKNPAYMGQAVFGRRKAVTKVKPIRAKKGSCEQSKNNYSVAYTEKENWIYIPVPPIIDKDIFDVVQEQLEENRKIARTKKRRATYLLQGLIVCQCCHYAYYGKPVSHKRGGGN
jgi:site-specific DNA recombinase